jgi:hypothetical protein
VSVRSTIRSDKTLLVFRRPNSDGVQLGRFNIIEDGGIVDKIEVANGKDDYSWEVKFNGGQAERNLTVVAVNVLGQISEPSRLVKGKLLMKSSFFYQRLRFE